MSLIDSIAKVFCALLIWIKNWFTFLKVIRVDRAENSNIRPECCENSNPSNTVGVGSLSNDDTHVNLPEKSAQSSCNTPEDNVTVNMRAEYSQNRDQSNPFEGLLCNNNAYINLPSTSLQFIVSSPEVNVSSNARAECAQNKNQLDRFEERLLSSNGACVNLPSRSVQLFNHVQADDVNQTENNFENDSEQSNKINHANVAKTDGGATNFENRDSSIAVETSEVELMPVSERKRFKGVTPVYKGITTTAADGFSSNQGCERHGKMPLILTHRKRKLCSLLK